MPKKNDEKSLSALAIQELLNTLQSRFKQNMNRHQALKWDAVQAKLLANPEKLWSLSEMERTGGEPDVFAYDQKTKEYIFYDCSAESPSGRRSLCYDQTAREFRKTHQPRSSAMEMASSMEIKLLTEEEYRQLQELGDFDLKTSSWIITPPKIRELGGALFADFRYNQVFIYHNGAESYYASRGFRASVRI